MGSGKMMVEFFSADMELSVCKFVQLLQLHGEKKGSRRRRQFLVPASNGAGGPTMTRK